jgi:hypothetical protein
MLRSKVSNMVLDNSRCGVERHGIVLRRRLARFEMRLTLAHPGLAPLTGTILVPALRAPYGRQLRLPASALWGAGAFRRILGASNDCR